MNEKNDNFEKFVKKELEKEAEDIRREMQEAILSPEVRERIQESLEKKIDKYDRDRLYAALSEEDREALRLGREFLGDGSGDKKGFVIRKKFRMRTAFVLAAVLVLVMAVGATSVGMLDRVIQIVKVAVGEREVVQIDSGVDDTMIVEENEEEAYQLIGEEFEAEPIRIAVRPEGMEFQKLEYDKGTQVAELYYTYNNQQLLYMVSATYRDSSWGIDVEDKVTKEYQKETRGCMIQVKEYETLQSKTHRYSAKFKYKGIEYFMFGTMKQEEFDKILENLHIFS